MIHPFVLYEAATGKIVSRGRVPTLEDLALQGEVFPGLASLPIEVGDMNTVYVVDGEIQRRPEFLILVSDKDFVADGETEMRLAGFPDPCVIVVNGEEHELTGGELTLTADTPAAYRIECKHWPFMDWAYELEAKEPGA